MSTLFLLLGITVGAAVGCKIGRNRELRRGEALFYFYIAAIGEEIGHDKLGKILDDTRKASQD